MKEKTADTKVNFTLDELLQGMEEQGILEQYLCKNPVGEERFWEEE